MNEPPKSAPPKEGPEPEPSEKDRLLAIQQYIAGLKEILAKLRRRFH
jgi:hypothetical protein